MLVRKPLNVEPTAVTTLPSPPLATTRTATPSPMTARARSSRNGRARPGPRSTRRWVATRLATVGRGRGGAGVGRPVEGGRGRTCGGRPLRRVVIGVDCRTRRAASGPGFVALRSVVVLRGPARGLDRSLARAALRDGCRHETQSAIVRRDLAGRPSAWGRLPA